MRISSSLAIPAIYFTLFTLGCSSEPGGGSEGTPGSLRAAIDMGASAHDVTAVRFDIVAADSACDAIPIASRTVPLDGAFAASLFTLTPGDYRACATPLKSDSSASEDCAQASDLATVIAEESLELRLVSQCEGTPNGGADVAVTFNDPPQITDVTVTESTHLTICESATLAVSVEDPNGDALSYEWSVVSGPLGGRLNADDASATFSGSVGDYVLRVTVTDAHAAHASFSVTLHVADATCVVPPEVQDIIESNCAPCHTTGSSGGLKLDPADVAYTSLVDHGAGAAACSSQVRVIPGDAADSYLIAKLRGAAGICGAQMPRGKPPLAEEQIQTIESWIDSLPH